MKLLNKFSGLQKVLLGITIMFFFTSLYHAFYLSVIFPGIYQNSPEITCGVGLKYPAVKKEALLELNNKSGRLSTATLETKEGSGWINLKFNSWAELFDKNIIGFVLFHYLARAFEMLAYLLAIISIFQIKIHGFTSSKLIRNLRLIAVIVLFIPLAYYLSRFFISAFMEVSIKKYGIDFSLGSKPTIFAIPVLISLMCFLLADLLKEAKQLKQETDLTI